MRRCFRLLIPLVGCVTIAMATVASASKGEMGRRYLAIDQALHADLAHMELEMGQASDRRAILKLDGERWTFPDLEHSIVDLTPHLRVSTHPQATSEAK